MENKKVFFIFLYYATVDDISVTKTHLNLNPYKPAEQWQIYNISFVYTLSITLKKVLSSHSSDWHNFQSNR